MYSQSVSVTSLFRLLQMLTCSDVTITTCEHFIQKNVIFHRFALQKNFCLWLIPSDKEVSRVLADAVGLSVRLQLEKFSLPTQFPALNGKVSVPLTSTIEREAE